MGASRNRTHAQLALLALTVTPSAVTPRRHDYIIFRNMKFYENASIVIRFSLFI